MVYFIFSCQTYEGGFSGCPGMEAHGGYAFCGTAALVILNKGHLIDQQALLVRHLGIQFGYVKFIEILLIEMVDPKTNET